MLEFIMNYWIEVAFGLVLSALAAGYKYLKKEIDDRTEENRAMKKAMVAILQQTLYDSYNKWSEKGYCPIFALEVCTRVYEQYHILGGNDVGTELYERLRELPTQPKDTREIKETKETTSLQEENKEE